MENKVAFISGPMSGFENGNFEVFKYSQIYLEKKGYIVMNPHETRKDIYSKWSKTIDSEEKISERTIELMWRDFTKDDIKYLIIADCVFVLENWESCKGSNLQLMIAQKLGIPIYYMKNLLEFDVTFQLIRLDKMCL